MVRASGKELEKSKLVIKDLEERHIYLEEASRKAKAESAKAIDDLTEKLREYEKTIADKDEEIKILKNTITEAKNQRKDDAERMKLKHAQEMYIAKKLIDFS